MKSVLHYLPHCIRSVCLFTFQGKEETRKKSEVVNAGGISYYITTLGPEERRARRRETKKGSGAVAQDSDQ